MEVSALFHAWLFFSSAQCVSLEGLRASVAEKNVRFAGNQIPDVQPLAIHCADSTELLISQPKYFICTVLCNSLQLWETWKSWWCWKEVREWMIGRRELKVDSNRYAG
jgi:hypothetical protein